MGNVLFLLTFLDLKTKNFGSANSKTA